VSFFVTFLDKQKS